MRACRIHLNCAGGSSRGMMLWGLVTPKGSIVVETCSGLKPREPLVPHETAVAQGVEDSMGKAVYVQV